MYIAPNTIVRLLRDCPLDKTYDHTIYFSSAIDQNNYFASLAKYTLTEQTYQRANRGVMRVQYKADLLYDCNYLMFQNTNYGTKWFYAFITSVEYINNITSEITYELDVMQTWMFDYRLGECFIEREHSRTDNIGDNTVPENLELGPYVADDFDGSYVLNGFSIVVAATFDTSFTNIAGSVYGGIFSGLYYHVFDNSDDGAIQCAAFLSEATEKGKSDGIVSVFLMKSAMVTGLLGSVRVYNMSKRKELSSIGSYIPRNRKLFTYPYNFLYVTNLQGNSAEYHYELFSGFDCPFIVCGDMSPNPSVILAPQDYKGVPTNYDEKMALTGFPQLPYNIDSFKAWLAQSGASLSVSALSTALSSATAIAAAATPLAAAAAPVSAAVATAGVVAQVYEHSIMPPQSKGGGGSITTAAMGIMDFCFMHKHIKPEYAAIIDDYFNMYGYATHRVKVPNRDVRPHWTYTKTIGCVVNGSVPADDMAKIISIYDRGITHWRNGNEVGNYSLNNSV